MNTVATEFEKQPREVVRKAPIGADIDMAVIKGNQVHHFMVYQILPKSSFIGSVFDPDTQGHAQKLKEMDPINFETALLLMSTSDGSFLPQRRRNQVLNLTI